MPLVRVSNGGTLPILIPEGKALRTYNMGLATFVNIPTSSTSASQCTYIFARGDYTTLHIKTNSSATTNRSWADITDGVITTHGFLSSSWKTVNISNYDYIICSCDSTSVAYDFYVS